MKKNQKLIEAETQAGYFFLIIFNKGSIALPKRQISFVRHSWFFTKQHQVLENSSICLKCLPISSEAFKLR